MTLKEKQRNPNLYFEFTDKNFKLSPHKIKEEGHLSDSWNTLRMFRILAYTSGLYLAYDLHKTPCYQRPYKMRSMIESDVKEKNINIEVITQDICEEKYVLYHCPHEFSIYMNHVMSEKTIYIWME